MGTRASGGVSGAVAQLADDVYERLSAPEQEIARGVLLRLAEPGMGSDDVRRRAPLEELVVDEEHACVLATLVEHRLVVSGDVTAEVAHEALLREWPRLRGWLESDREGRRVQHALSSAAQDWARGGRNDDLLFRRVPAGRRARRLGRCIRPSSTRWSATSWPRDVPVRTPNCGEHAGRRGACVG